MSYRNVDPRVTQHRPSGSSWLTRWSRWRGRGRDPDPRSSVCALQRVRQAPGLVRPWLTAPSHVPVRVRLRPTGRGDAPVRTDTPRDPLTPLRIPARVLALIPYT